MTCETCPIVVRKALQRVPGVSSASVDFALKTATVTFDPDQAKLAALTQATTNAGFPSALKATP
jgi:mercuric ion binding protein